MKYHKGQKVVISNPVVKEYKGKIITLTYQVGEGWMCEENMIPWIEEELSPLEKTWKTLQAGDIVIVNTTRRAKELKVLARINDLVALSDPHIQYLFNGWSSIESMKRFNYTIKQDKLEEETIEILGKTYKKDDVVKKLKGLKEV